MRFEEDVIITVPMSDLAVHYCARTVIATDAAGAYVTQSEIPQ